MREIIVGSRRRRRRIINWGVFWTWAVPIINFFVLCIWAYNIASVLAQRAELREAINYINSIECQPTARTDTHDGLKHDIAVNSRQRTSDLRVEIGEAKEVTITVNTVDKQSMIQLIATVFGKGDEAKEQDFHKLLQNSPKLTLIMTSGIYRGR